MKLKSLGTSIWFAALAILLFCYSSAIAEDKLTPSSDLVEALDAINKEIEMDPEELENLRLAVILADTSSNH